MRVTLIKVRFTPSLSRKLIRHPVGLRFRTSEGATGDQLVDWKEIVNTDSLLTLLSRVAKASMAIAIAHHSVCWGLPQTPSDTKEKKASHLWK